MVYYSTVHLKHVCYIYSYISDQKFGLVGFIHVFERSLFCSPTVIYLIKYTEKTVQIIYIFSIQNSWFVCVMKAVFSASLLQSSVSHDLQKS